MKNNNVEMRLLIKGRPIPEFPHEEQTYVEGRSGSNFEIEVTNHNPYRIEAIISVDGLSIIDGKEASERSTGYVLQPHQKTRIPGWTLTSSDTAAFVFAGKGKAYATQMTGSAQNTGVIGLIAYREKPISPVFRSTFASSVGGSGDFTPRGITTSSNSMMKSVSATASSMAADTAQLSASAVQQSLGTGFGERTAFATKTVSFTRGDMLCMSVLHYDSLKGLKARGVQMERIAKAQYRPAPQAFPGMGCAIPPGWKG